MAELKSIRQTFLADENCVFVRCDMSQIEHRLCLMYTRADHLREIANKHPSEYDGHVEIARVIFRKQHIDKRERYLGKRVVHGSERAMSGNVMSETILKDTEGELFVHPKECNRMIESFFRGFPEIREVYFPWVRQRVIEDQVCVNSWGRRWKCDRVRIDNELFKRAYSFYLQSECADWVNQYLFKPMSAWMEMAYGKPCSFQNHDEVGVSVPLEDAYDVAKLMVALAEQERVIMGGVLRCPAEITVGKTWGDGCEWKRLPDKETFYERFCEAYA